MSETINYNLHLTDDGSERFQDWRNAMNGPVDSNMIKIDAALGKKADSSIEISAVLLASAWTGADSPYTQEIAIDGLTEEQNGMISVAPNATAEQREVVRNALLSVESQSEGKLVIVADGELPSQDIPVSIILLG